MPGTVLEGSVRHAGHQLRVTAQLSRTADGYQLWTESYDRQLADSLSVQADIARAIATALKLRLPAVAAEADARRVPTRDVEAHDLYLRGRFEWNKRTVDAMHRSIDYLQRAIDRDPTCALAWMGLATNHATMAMNNAAEDERRIERRLHAGSARHRPCRRWRATSYRATTRSV
jgi:adenylate cyclase